MAKHVILVRQTSQLRRISEEEVVGSLAAAEQRFERHHFEVAMAQFSDAVDQNHWGGHDSYLRKCAAEILQEVSQRDDVLIHYFGLAEVPHMIAFGSRIGSEQAVVLHDFDRDRGAWNWTSDSQTLDLTAIGTEPLAIPIDVRGHAVIRVAISASISDADVGEVVSDVLADVTITHSAGTDPAVALIRSRADVEAVRREFRRVYAMVRNQRPRADMIHLFVAAPASVCFAIGQELVLRNSPPVQTYRFRKNSELPSQQPAILLSAAGEQVPLVSLTREQIDLARTIRTEVWPSVLKDLDAYISRRCIGDTRAGPYWFSLFSAADLLQSAKPFPALPSLEKVVKPGASVFAEQFSGDFDYDETLNQWKLSDQLAIGFYEAANADEGRLKQLIRLFLFHEYVHLHQRIGKYGVEEVGKFPNCLEYIDYVADAYGLLHQFDLRAIRNPGVFHEAHERVQTFLTDQIDLAIRSFWVFDRLTGNEWQIRRLRRYFNWYWRLVQIENSTNPQQVFHLLARQPRVEIGGLSQFTQGRRVLARLNRLDPTTQLELAIVLEDDKLFRQSTSPNINLHVLLQAVLDARHEEIKDLFRAVYSTASGFGGVQPVIGT